MSTNKPKSALVSLQDRVAKIYYTHGLFCSTHPIPVICFALIIILLCCYPFVNFPLPGNVPQEYVTPANLYSLPLAVDGLDENFESVDKPPLKPHWYNGPPVGYVQQILVRTVVSPWNKELFFMDSFRGPLSKVFDVLEMAQNYELNVGNGSVMLNDICVHISESKVKNVKDHLPMYGCLAVSPANVWKQNMQMFLEDADIIGTILSLRRNTANPSTSLADILFGVPWKETAFKKYYTWNRQRVLSFAITIILKRYDANFIQGLEARLHHSFPFLHANESVSTSNITHVYFHGHYNFVEFIPLTVTYVILFLYIYFSVRKIEMVKSKIGMAFSAVVTVLASLCMSVGLCTWFGLSFTIKAGQVYLKDIFPYLVVIVGLENILVLTKSVVSTPVNLDVKVRLAQGLSKEGWSITKNLVTELSILTFGFFTFVPAIQEFCLFAVVGLLSDFFLQLVFFATILAVDIGRMEMSDLQRQSMHQNNQPSEEELNHMYPLFSWPQVSRCHRSEAKASLPSSYSNQSVSSTSDPSHYPANVVAPNYRSSKKVPFGKVPKRLRVVYFWARCRIFQRAFMITFLIWVAFIVYKSGIVNLLTLENSTLQFSVSPVFPPRDVVTSETPTNVVQSTVSNNLDSFNEDSVLKHSNASSTIDHKKVNVSKALKHKDYDLWRYLQPDHWPTLFGYFNLSVTARYVSILPSIKLSIPVSHEEAVHVRHPSEHQSTRFHWPASAIGQDGSETEGWKEEDGDDGLPTPSSHIRNAYYPSTPAELILTAVLAIPSIIFLIYVMIVMYQCICSRNYAEWRSSWSDEDARNPGDIFTQLVIEAMPVVLEGHPQEVECLATDGNFVVSTCLAGEIRVWDSMSGECLTVINRKKLSNHQNHNNAHKDCEIEGTDDFPSDYESGSPPSRSESFISPAPKRVTSSSSINDIDERSHVVYNSSKIRGTISAAANVDDLFVFEKDFSKPRRRELFTLQPNLSSTINTDFVGVQSTKRKNSKPNVSPNEGGYDFKGFQIYYDEHRQLMEEEDEQESYRRRLIHMSSGELSPNMMNSPKQEAILERSKLDVDERSNVCSAVWCVDCKDNIIVAGCCDGKIEFWDTLTGSLKYVHEETSHEGVTGIRIYGSRVIAVRLNGSVDFLQIVPVQNVDHLMSTQSPFSMHRRTNYQLGSGSPVNGSCFSSYEEEITCHWLHTSRAHQQPITVLEVEGGKAVTGSQDHTLKVFRVDDTVCISTLHGHYGPITTLFIDKLSPMTAASGSQDGAVCLWDLQTGTCVCQLRGHDGAVTALSYTASYVLSAGTDNRLLVWERFQGHLLNTINLSQNYCNSIIMLTDNLLLTGRQGSLGIWDIRLGDPVRIVRLGHADDSVLVRQVRHVGHTIVCDYGSQLRVVRFPAIVEKVD